MITIGFRVKPDEVTFVVLDTNELRLLNVEGLKIPKALADPDALKYVRNSVLDVLREYEVVHAGLRMAESIARRPSHRRIQIEGVIKEAFASSRLVDFYCGQIATISARVGMDRKDFKRYVRGDVDLDRFESWRELSEAEREAALTALGAENA